jgi:hypothetical protein
MSLRKFAMACFVLWLVGICAWKLLDMNSAPQAWMAAFIAAVALMAGVLSIVFGLVRKLFRSKA